MLIEYHVMAALRQLYMPHSPSLPTYSSTPIHFPTSHPLIHSSTPTGILHGFHGVCARVQSVAQRKKQIHHQSQKDVQHHQPRFAGTPPHTVITVATNITPATHTHTHAHTRTSTHSCCSQPKIPMRCPAQATPRTTPSIAQNWCENKRACLNNMLPRPERDLVALPNVHSPPHQLLFLHLLPPIHHLNAIARSTSHAPQTKTPATDKRGKLYNNYEVKKLLGKGE